MNGTVTADGRMRGRDPFLSAARALLAESGCVVKAWRSSMSGVAYVGSEEWWIEVPEPRGPISFACFAHEVGHQLLHRPGGGRHAIPRWTQEIEAWEFALAQFERFDLPGSTRAIEDACSSLQHSFQKAIRRSCDRDALKQKIADRAPSWLNIDIPLPEPLGFATVNPVEGMG